MGVMEFTVTTDLSPVAQTKIETNFEAVRDWLTAELAPYASMIVSPDSISDAKKTRASIRKVGESIDSQRKAIKKLWNKPYEDYENKCKELTGIVNDAVSNIDGQIKAMENEVKEQKRQRLEDLFTEKSQDIADYISFEAVFDSKWLNATFSEIDAANSIVEQLEGVRTSLEIIRSMGSPYETAMLSEFAKTHSLPAALREGKRLEEIQKAEEERKAREEEASLAATWEVGGGEDVEEPIYPTPQVQAQTDQFIRPMAEEPPKPKMYTLRFEVTGTAEAFGALKRCMIANNLEYKKL